MQPDCQGNLSESGDPSLGSALLSGKGFDLDTLPELRTFSQKFPPISCEYNLVNLFSWAHIYKYQWFSYKDRFLVYDHRNNVMMMPLGNPMTPEALAALSHGMACTGRSPHYCLASRSYIEENPKVYDFFEVEEDRDAAEYIYLTRNLVQLNSTKLHKKKNLVSQFHRRHPEFRVGQMKITDLPNVEAFAMDLLRAMEWAPKSLQEEFTAIQAAFGNWEILNLEGLLLWVGDKIAAFSVFSRLNSDTFNVHFEKANIAYKGAAQVINQETAKFLEKRSVYINREQDLGIKGLRQAKLSYEPHSILVPYSLRLKTNA